MHTKSAVVLILAFGTVIGAWGTQVWRQSIVGEWGADRLSQTRTEEGILRLSNGGAFDDEAVGTRALVIMDFDRDGYPDIVAGRSTACNAVYTNNHRAAFYPTEAGDFDNATNNTYAMVSFDADGDGDLDLAVVYHAQPNAFYRNDGSNTFTQIDAGDFDNSGGSDEGMDIVAFDADGDDDLDLAVANYGEVCEYYRNDGNNQFTLTDAGDFDDTARSTTRLLAFDADGDDDIDLVAGHYGQAPVFYRNNGSGQFSAVNAGDLDLVARNVTALAAVDADGDGKTDIAVGTEGQTNVLFRNTGTNQFMRMDAGQFDDDLADTRCIAVFDINQDGLSDLAVGNMSLPSAFYVNDGHGFFNRVNAGSFDDRAMGTLALATADVNMDGVPDLMVGNEDQPDEVHLGVRDETPVVLAPAGGSGGYQARNAGDLDDTVGDTVAAMPIDIERDGRYELLIGGIGQRKELYRIDGTGAFVRVEAGDLDDDNSQTRCFAVFDMEWDDDDDIAVGNQNQPNELYKNIGSNLFVKVDAGDFDDTAYSTYAVAASDVNGDGKADLVVGNDAEPNLVFTNNTTGVFTRVEAGDFDNSNQNTRAVAVFDANGDGYNDIAVANYGRANALYLNTGSNWFVQTEAGDFDDAGGNTQSVAMVAFDIDGDRNTDLVVGNRSEPIEVFFNNGTGIFTRVDAGDIDDDAHETQSLLVYDANQDGTLDILVVNATPEPSALFIGNEQGRFVTADAGDLDDTPSESRNAAALDVDEDGDDDLVIVNSASSNQLWAWGMDLAETGSITSVAITPSLLFTNYGPLVRWQRLHVYHKLPTNTDITYDILDPNTGSPVPGSWTGLRPGSSNYIDLSSLNAASITSIQVRATLAQSDGGAGNDWDDRTPELYRWAVVFEMTNAKSFFWSWDQDILDFENNPFRIRANAVSGWFSPEGYMLALDRVHERHRSSFSDIDLRIWALLQSNDTKKAEFWSAYYTNFTRYSDLATMKSWGFNAIRLPFNYRMLSPWATPGVYDSNGFNRLDMAIQWCKSNGLYVILDMHCCPGGQSHDPPVDSEWTYWSYDSWTSNWWEHGVPVLWNYDGGYYSNTLQQLGVGRTPEFNKTRTADLWREIARRYKDEEWIIGYELINEPYLPWGVHSDDLRDLFIRVTAAVREVDRNHLVFTEGNFYASTFEGMVPPWDNNTVLIFHKYWRPAVFSEIDEYIAGAREYNLPMFNSEAGENSNPWFFEFKQLLESNNVSWCWWGDKKVDSIVAAHTAPISSNYQYVIDYFRDSPVDTNRIWQGLMELASNVASSVCRFDPSYYGAILSTNYNYRPLPYSNNVIPGPIQCANYDIGNQGIAYWDYTVANTSNWDGPPWNTGWAYRNDAVDVFGCGDTHAWSIDFHVGDTEAGEWLKYTVNVLTQGLYDLTFRMANSNAAGSIRFSLDGDEVCTITAPPTTNQWTTFSAPPACNLSTGVHTLVVSILSGNLNLSWVAFTLSELVVNGALTGSGSQPDNWLNWNDGSHDADTGTYRSSPNSWGFWWDGGLYQDITNGFSAGNTLTFGGWMYVPSWDPLRNGSKCGVVQIEFYNNNTLLTSSNSPAVNSSSPTDTWIQLESTAIVPDSTTKLRILVRCNDYSSGDGRFLADDIYIH